MSSCLSRPALRADGGGLVGLGWYSAGRDRWRVKRAAGGMSEDHDRCFSTLVLGAFSTGVFNTNALPRINIGSDVWGESSIMTGVY